MLAATTKEALEKYLLKNIPIAEAMGINVESASALQVVLKASSAKNINHKKTVFGGSLHSIATLACWCLLHLNLTEKYGDKVQIVISHSEVSYLAPVISDFKAECSLPTAEEWSRFLKMLEKKGKGRLTLKAKIFEGEQLAVDYSGTFVASLKIN